MVKGALGIESIECLPWNCRDTLVGEVKMSMSSSTNLFTCFCYVEWPHAKAISIVMIFHSPSNIIMTRTNLLI